MPANATLRCPVCGGPLDDASNGACPACGVALSTRAMTAAKADGLLSRREIRLEIADLRRQLDVDPVAADVWHELGLHYERLFLLLEAERAYGEALRHMPENVLVRTDLASLHAVRAAGGDHAAAAAAREQARLLLRLDDDPAPGRLILAQLAAQDGSFDVARAEIRAATTLDPRDRARRLVWIDLADAANAFITERGRGAIAIWRQTAVTASDSTRATVLAALADRRAYTIAAARRVGVARDRRPDEVRPRLDWQDHLPTPFGPDGSGFLSQSSVRWWAHLVWMLACVILASYLAVSVPAFLAVGVFIYLPGARGIQLLCTRSTRTGTHGRNGIPAGSDRILARLETPDMPMETLLTVAERVARAAEADARRARIAWQDNQPVALPAAPAVSAARARRPSG